MSCYVMLCYVIMVCYVYYVMLTLCDLILPDPILCYVMYVHGALPDWSTVSKVSEQDKAKQDVLAWRPLSFAEKDLLKVSCMLLRCMLMQGAWVYGFAVVYQF